MDEKMRIKYVRLNDRINELSTLNTNIAKLAFYLNENKIEYADCANALQCQLDFMIKYRDALQDRITNGYY